MIQLFDLTTILILYTIIFTSLILQSLILELIAFQDSINVNYQLESLFDFLLPVYYYFINCLPL